MAVLTLGKMAAWTGGKILQGSPDMAFKTFSIDSRQVKSGGLFFAIQGNRDGHDFVQNALDRGAAGAVVSRPVGISSRDFALLSVDDTILALQKLAQSVIAARGEKIKIVGITGSVGKTTTKDFTAELLGSRFNVHKSLGNFNNNLGLSLSILAMEEQIDIAVLEMAMTGPGEILGLTRIAPPDVAVITNISPVHLCFFKDIEGIAEAKKEILLGAKPGSTAVLNGNDPLVQKISSDWKSRIIWFGYEDNFDVKAEAIRRLDDGSLAFNLKYGETARPVCFNFVNEALVENLMAAAGVALAFGLTAEEITARINGLQPSERRGIWHYLGKNIKLYDDSYNSNPRALAAILKSLGKLRAKRKVAILGDMLELGPAEKEYHSQAGQVLVDSGWDMLVSIGPLAAVMAESAAQSGLTRKNIYMFPDSASAVSEIARIIQPGDLVLVKGSNAMKMDLIVEEIKSEKE